MKMTHRYVKILMSANCPRNHAPNSAETRWVVLFVPVALDIL